MKLSILIPSIPSRFDRAQKLYSEISRMCQGKDIEVLMLVDNKKRTIGEKREALKNISQGKYFMFVDDDDSLLSVEEIYKACEHNVNVITFKQRCFNNDGSEFIVTFGLGNQVEHNSENGNYLDSDRPPFHVCAWHHKFKKIHFPCINYGEDGVWSLMANKQAFSEFHIDKVLHSYNFNPKVTEANTDSNKHWENPNIYRAVVNFATEEYKKGQERLFNSLLDLSSRYYSIIGFGSDNLEVPDHKENPYAFKIYAIEKVKEDGYNQILWLDASVYAVKDISPVFDLISKNGFFLEDSGHKIGEWCNDRTLEYYEITREQAMHMPMISSGFVGIDFLNPVGAELFERWKQAMEDGMFKGSWDDHRHDQTCLSIIACQMGLAKLFTPERHFFAYIGEVYGEPKETAVCHLEGIR